MDELAQLGVACMFSAATKEEIENWIAAAAVGGEVDPAIFEIYSKDVKVSRSRFEKHFHKIYPDFKIDSDEGIRACKTVLGIQIERLHKREIAPYEFCRFICELESCYMDKASMIEEMIAMPEFLGDLWNACDWCDESWTLDGSVYLEEESKRVAETL